jgi:hypothetical protein
MEQPLLSFSRLAWSVADSLFGSGSSLGDGAGVPGDDAGLPGGEVEPSGVVGVPLAFSP